MERFEVESQELCAVVNTFDPTIMVIIVTEEGPNGIVFKHALQELFKYRCLRDKLGQLTKQDMLISWVVRGTREHKDFLTIYEFDVAPIIVFQNRKIDHPAACFKLDIEEREGFCALSIEMAMSATLEGISIDEMTSFPPESYNKYVAVSLDGNEIYADQDNFEVKSIDCPNDTREVEIQCNWLIPITPRRQCNEHTSGCRVTNRIGQVTVNHHYNDVLIMEPVWFIDKTAALPAQAASRLQILLPNRGPIHVAVRNTGTMSDVYTFVSFVLGVTTNSLEISSRYPYRRYGRNEMLCTIKNLQLVPSAVLIAKILRGELIQPDRTVTGIIRNIATAMFRPFLTVFSGFWSRIQSMFYSPEELEVDDRDRPPHVPTNSRQSNVFDEDDDGKDDDDQDDHSEYFDTNDKVPNYNGNSTQLL